MPDGPEVRYRSLRALLPMFSFFFFLLFNLVIRRRFRASNFLPCAFDITIEEQANCYERTTSFTISLTVYGLAV